MKSIFHIALLSMAIALVAGITTTTIAPQAFAEHNPEHENADDKNNPTSPGGGAGNFPPEHALNDNAAEKNEDNCIKQFAKGTGGPPAQCYSGDGK